jgi:hypothetical protein
VKTYNLTNDIFCFRVYLLINWGVVEDCAWKVTAKAVMEKCGKRLHGVSSNEFLAYV